MRKEARVFVQDSVCMGRSPKVPMYNGNMRIFRIENTFQYAANSSSLRVDYLDYLDRINSSPSIIN